MPVESPQPNVIQPMAAPDVAANVLAGGAIAFAVANLNPLLSGQPVAVVCISTDANQWGNLSITIQNNTNGSVNLDTSSLVKLYAPALLTSDEINAITLAGSAWSGKAVGSGSDCYFALSPATAIGLPSGGSTSVQLQNVLASGQPATRKFYFEYSGFDGTDDSSCDVRAVRQVPPKTANVEWPLQFSFQPRPQYGGTSDLGNSIYVTPWTAPDQGPWVVNTFVLQIENAGNSVIPLPSGASPAITLSFVAGDTANCLCTDEQANAVALGITQSDPGYQWQPEKDDESELPAWTIAPAAGSPNFLGLQGLVAVQLGNLSTDLPANSSTLLFVQYAGLSGHGYNDGVAVLPIEKLPPKPCITNFTASIAAWRDNGPSGPITAGSTVPYGTVTAAWDIFAANTATLTVDPPPVQPSVFTLATMSGSMPIPLPPGQFLDSVTYTYTLQAYTDADNPNNSNSQSETFSLTMSAAPGVQVTMTCWGYHLSTSTAYFSRVNWSTTYATGCQVLNGGGQPISWDFAGQVDQPGNWSFQINATGPGITAQPSGSV